MKETIKEIIGKNFPDNTNISIYKTKVGTEYKIISVIDLSTDNYSTEYLIEYAENDLYLSLLEGIGLTHKIVINGYRSSVNDYSDTKEIYVDVSFYYPIPITDRVTRKSMLTLLSLV